MDVQRINVYRKELMGLATLWIFYFHVGPVLLSESRLTLLKEFEWYVNIIGYCGVEIFLFLSGMGLVYAIHERDIFSFYIRRFLRVYPAFWIWFTASTLVRHDSMSWTEYIGRITFYSNWTKDLLTYKWYIAAILMFYLCFPVYYSVMRKRKNPVMFTAMLIILEFCSASIFYDYIRFDLFLFFNRIPIFITGVLAGHYCLEDTETGLMQYRMSSGEWRFLCIFVMAVNAGNFYLHKLDVKDWSYNIQNACNAVIAVGLCIICAKWFELAGEDGLIKKIRIALSWLGSVSLEFYLTHELIALKVKSYDLHFLSFDKGNQVIVVFICFVISLFAAWILRKLVDVFIIWKSKYMGNSRLQK